MAKNSHKALKKKRARELLNKLLEDADILDIYTEEMEKRGIVGASVALTIQGELEELKEKNITDFINRIVQVLKKDLYWVKIST